jgi:hypothetical protein
MLSAMLGAFDSKSRRTSTQAHRRSSAERTPAAAELKCVTLEIAIQKRRSPRLFSTAVEAEMALARCETCGSPRGLKHNYTHVHNLVASVNSSILCGVPTCVRPACIWLTDEEEQQYVYGQRSFQFSNHALHAQVI